MKLTRRDAAAALAAAGVGGAVIAADEVTPPQADVTADGPDGGQGDEPPRSSGDASASRNGQREHVIDMLVAVARIVYPSPVENVTDFVERVSRRRLTARPDHASGVRAAVAEIDDHATRWTDRSFLALSHDDRESVLREMAVDVADPDPDGVTAERVRYYVVNDLLFALYASPTGGRLVGIENPQGHPGGTASYQRGPE